MMSRAIVRFARSARTTRFFAVSTGADGTKFVDLIWVTPEGEELPVKAKVGAHLLDVAHDNGVDLEGACEASLACSTCHVILEPEQFDRLEDEQPPLEEEEDLLDMAFGLTDTSRLGCQVTVTEDMDGARVSLPAATRNFYVDGHKPQPH
ncbi:MAG: hypothetical protein MHM6MM_005487 [Cercozoa sp. M6MM]